MPKRKSPSKRLKSATKKRPKSTASKPRPKPKKRKIVWGELNTRQRAAVLTELVADLAGRATLVGSACAAIYAPALQPCSIDLVVERYHVEKMEKLMHQLGFKSRELRSFTHRKEQFDVSFPPPPLVVGDEIIQTTERVKSHEGPVELLNPTDCVRHRLAAWYRWSDQSAFVEAVAVAKRNEIDLEVIRRWSEWEWALEKFEAFSKAVSS